MHQLEVPKAAGGVAYVLEAGVVPAGTLLWQARGDGAASRAKSSLRVAAIQLPAGRLSACAELSVAANSCNQSATLAKGSARADTSPTCVCGEQPWFTFVLRRNGNAKQQPLKSLVYMKARNWQQGANVSFSRAFLENIDPNEDPDLEPHPDLRHDWSDSHVDSRGACCAKPRSVKPWLTNLE